LLSLFLIRALFFPPRADGSEHFFLLLFPPPPLGVNDFEVLPSAQEGEQEVGPSFFFFDLFLFLFFLAHGSAERTLPGVFFFFFFFLRRQAREYALSFSFWARGRLSEPSLPSFFYVVVGNFFLSPCEVSPFFFFFFFFLRGEGDLPFFAA